MVSHLSLRLPLLHTQSFGSEIRRNINTNVLNSSGFNGKEQDKFLFSKNKSSFEFLFKYYTTSSHVSLKAFSSTTTSASDQASNESDSPITEAEGDEMEFNRVNCLVWVLHESARSFSHAIESLELPGSGAELAMAWNGKDVHEWHRRIAYRVAVYALLKMAIEVENLLSQDRHNIHAPVKEILSPKMMAAGEFIENQLSMRHSELLQWFRIVELPRIAGFFSSLLKKWSIEYAGRDNSSDQLLCCNRETGSWAYFLSHV